MIYVGKVDYGGQVYEGEHDRIIDDETWNRVQSALSRNGRCGGRNIGNKYSALLKGLVRCGSCDVGMVHTYVNKKDRLYRYYVCVKPGEDGFMIQHFNPTGSNSWRPVPETRNLHTTLVPIVGRNGGWSQALVPTQLAWMFQENTPADWNMPKPTYPELWIVYRSNPAISFWETRRLADSAARFPFTVAFAYTVDETN